MLAFQLLMLVVVSPLSASIWVGFLLLLALLNLRFALGLPIFTLTPSTGGRAIRQSWRLTRGWVSVRLEFVHLGTMQQLSQHPNTLVLGHRGFSDLGAENTIGGHEAAAAHMPISSR